MKTRCPNCQTSFRITPEQLKARFGKVRCGQCQTVFNALDTLLDEPEASVPERPVGVPPPAPFFAATRIEPAREAANETLERIEPVYVEPPPDSPGSEADLETGTEAPTEAGSDARNDTAPEASTEDDEPAAARLSESEAQELGRATGLIMPRETTAIPGYSKWVEGMVSPAPASLPAEHATRWPFVVAALLLAVTLCGQLVVHWRSEIVVAAPGVRPLIAALSRTVGVDLPLPRRVELVSIETSDLQSDPTRGNLLVLNATLRNRAGYAQAYPALELSLTDTQDAAIARRVFSPAEYLAPALAANPAFAANAEIAVKLWIEARQISAAGYRLYVFYP